MALLQIPDRHSRRAAGKPLCAAVPLNSPCPFRKSYPDVFVMQSAEDWDGSNVADPLNNALQGCVLLQLHHEYIRI